MPARYIFLALWSLDLVLVAGLFLAPITLEPGTVQGLDGRANVMDYGARWATLPTFPRIVYAFGDLVCHQMETRTWAVGGNQMPVDVRMTLGFLGALVGLPAALLLPNVPRVRDQVLAMIPRRWRGSAASPNQRLWLLWGFVALTLGPLVVDVACQSMGTESTSLRRATTGFLFGAGAGLSFAMCLKALFAPLPEASTRAVAN